MTAPTCPSAICPCTSCAGERGRTERIAQGLTERIEDAGFFRQWGVLLSSRRDRSAA